MTTKTIYRVEFGSSGIYINCGAVRAIEKWNLAIHEGRVEGGKLSYEENLNGTNHPLPQKMKFEDGIIDCFHNIPSYERYYFGFPSLGWLTQWLSPEVTKAFDYNGAELVVYEIDIVEGDEYAISQVKGEQCIFLERQAKEVFRGPLQKSLTEFSSPVKIAS